jgi:hypothetical protein
LRPLASSAARALSFFSSINACLRYRSEHIKNRQLHNFNYSLFNAHIKTGNSQPFKAMCQFAPRLIQINALLQ